MSRDDLDTQIDNAETDPTGDKGRDPVRTLVFRLTAVTLAVLTALSMLTSWAALGRFERVYLPELRHKAEAVGDVLTRQINRALDYGVPLESLPDLEQAIAKEIKGHGDIAYAAVVAGGGRLSARVGERVTLPPAIPPDHQGPLVAGYDDIVLPLQADKGGADRLELRIGIDPGYLATQSVDLMLEVAVEMLVSVLITFEILLLVVHLSTASANPARHVVRSAQQGDFRGQAPPVGGAREAALAGYRLLDRLNERYARLKHRVEAMGKTDDPVWRQFVNRYRFRDDGEKAVPPPVNLVYLRLPVFLFCLSEELSRSFMPAFAQSFAPSAPWLSPDLVVSLPITLFMLVWAVSQPGGARLSEVIGRRRAFIGGVALAVCGLAMTALSYTLAELLLWRMATALGYGVVLIAAQGIVIDHTTPRDRAGGLAMFIGGLLTAGVCGPATGGIIADQIGPRATFLVGAGLAALSGAVLPALFPADAPRSERSAQAPRRSGVALALSPKFAALMALSAIPTKIAATGILFCLIPLLLTQSGALKAEVGRTQMMYFLAFILVAPLAASFSDRRRAYGGMLAAGGIGTLIGAAALMSGGQWEGGLSAHLWVAPAAIALFGAAQALVAAPQVALATRIAVKAGVAETVALGWYRLLERLGGALGPLLAIFLSAAYSYAEAVVAIGLLCCFGGVTSWLLFRSDAKVENAGF